MCKKALPLIAIWVTAIVGPVYAGITVKKITAQKIDLSVTIPMATAGNRTTAPGLESTGIDFSKGVFPGAGKPAIPGFVEWILVPNGTTAELSVDKGSPVVYRNVTVPVVQGEGSEIAQTNGTFPDVFAELEPVKVLRGQSISKVWVYPYQYDASTRTLYVYNNCKLTVSFKGSPQHFRKHYFDETGANMLKRMAINAEAVLDAESYAPGLSKGLTTAGYNYLIITHDDFYDAAMMLASWKDSLGIITKVVKTSEIGGSPSAADIESFIDQEYAANNPPPAYLLLLGDYQFVPAYLDPYSDAGYQLTPSDWKYADIGDDYMIDMAYGRIPVNTLQTAMSVINRIKNHEKLSPYRPEFKKASVVSAWEGSATESRRFIKSCEDIRNYLVDKGTTVDRIYHAQNPAAPQVYNSGNDPSIPDYYKSFYLFENDIPSAPLPDELKYPAFAWNGSASTLTNAINDGRFFVTYHCHGTTDAWVSAQDNFNMFTSADADNLTNTFLPVIFSYACLNGRFNGQGECLTEHLLERNTGGAVGVFSSNNVLKSLGIGERMIWGCMDALWPDFIESNGGSYGPVGGTPLYRAGDIANYGKHYVMTFFKDLTNNWGVGFDSLNTMQMEWYGDPTMEIIPMTTNRFGDVNNDGLVDINDALSISRYTVNEPVNPFLADRADVDQDGTISIVDALIIARFCAGLSAMDFTAVVNNSNKTGEDRSTMKMRGVSDRVTMIECRIQAPSRVKLDVFDIGGRKVATISENQIRKAGTFTVAWNRKTSSPGIYFIRMYNDEKLAGVIKTMVR